MSYFNLKLHDLVFESDVLEWASEELYDEQWQCRLFERAVVIERGGSTHYFWELTENGVSIIAELLSFGCQHELRLKKDLYSKEYRYINVPKDFKISVENLNYLLNQQ